MSVIYRAFTGFAAISAAAAAAADVAAYAASGGIPDPSECPHCQCDKAARASLSSAQNIDAPTPTSPTASPVVGMGNVENPDFTFADLGPPVESV